MQSFETIILDEKDGVAWLQMNRPDAFNAINLTMAKELYQAAAYCSKEKTIRTVVWIGTGEVFCGGGGVKLLADAVKKTDQPDLLIKEMAMHFHLFVTEIARMPKPVIAAINGVAVGGGFSATLASIHCL
jgi:2-(1,2-epoxy-1,2-dihydrophenyl)acetyl-CoA isomerase